MESYTQETSVPPIIESSPVVKSDAGKAELKIFRSLAELEILRDSWKAWPGHRDADIDIYRMVVESSKEVLRPHVIALYRDGKPDVILIGRLERKGFKFKVGYVPLYSPRVRCLTFVYGAVRGNSSPENILALLQEVLRCLHVSEADLAQFEFVRLDSPLYRLALNLPGLLTRDSNPPSQLHHLLVLPDNIEAVYSAMSSSRRKEVRRNTRRLQCHAAGAPSVTCYESLNEFDHLFGDVEKIARKTYQRGLRVGFSDTPEIRSRLAEGARQGWLRAYVFYLGERPCAFWIGMLYENTFVSEYMGYDPEFSQFSPGMVLIMNVIERFCSGTDGNVRELDFGLGHAEYKNALCSTKWLEATIFLFGSTPRGVTSKAIRILAKLADRSARRILSSTGVIMKLKRTWRDRLASGKREPVH